MNEEFTRMWQNSHICDQGLFVPRITNLNRVSFASSAFPRAWRKLEVVPHLKDGDYEIPNNYVTFRTFQTDREDCFESVHWLSDSTRQPPCHQSGNHKYHSTETLSLLVTGHIFKAMDQKEITAMVLIDPSKAFDNICHRTLLLKLQTAGWVK